MDPVAVNERQRGRRLFELEGDPARRGVGLDEGEDGANDLGQVERFDRQFPALEEGPQAIDDLAPAFAVGLDVGEDGAQFLAVRGRGSQEEPGGPGIAEDGRQGLVELMRQGCLLYTSPSPRD